MKIEELVVRLEEGDRLDVNSNGIFIEHNGRLYLAPIRPEAIPESGLVTFRDYGLPEEGQTIMFLTYCLNRNVEQKSLF